jgi:hypothetical protein
VADAFVADVEDQRLTAAAAGVEARQSASLRVLHRVGVGADRRLVQQRQRLHVLDARDCGGIEALALEQVAVVRHGTSGFGQQGAQTTDLQRPNLLPGPPLRSLQPTSDGHRGVRLQALVQGKDQR